MTLRRVNLSRKWLKKTNSRIKPVRQLFDEPVFFLRVAVLRQYLNKFKVEYSTLLQAGAIAKGGKPIY
jgi:hypothetical protein